MWTEKPQKQMPLVYARLPSQFFAHAPRIDLPKQFSQHNWWGGASFLDSGNLCSPVVSAKLQICSIGPPTPKNFLSNLKLLRYTDRTFSSEIARRFLCMLFYPYLQRRTTEIGSPSTKYGLPNHDYRISQITTFISVSCCCGS